MRVLGAGDGNQREALRMFDGLHRKIDIELGPVEVVVLRPHNIEDLRYWRALEPREVLERQEQLSIVKEEPEALPRDVRNFNLRSACAKLFGFHPDVSL